VVIFNKEVASEYRFLIEDVYGISINITKSVIGDYENSQIEFTKRLALRGEEMSSIKRNILTKDNMQSMLELVDILLERDFISADTDRYGLYSFLSSREQAIFSFFLWVRSGCEAPFNWVTPPCSIDRETFNTMLKEKRSQRLMEKTAEIDKYLSEAKPLNEYYQAASLPHNGEVLGLGSHQSDNLMLHPIVWAINQTGIDMSIALSTIWDEPSPDVAPVEYLPIVSSKSYFSTPRKASKEYLSKLILDVFNELSDETQSSEGTP
jgi:hypothetical protein